MYQQGRAAEIGRSQLGDHGTQVSTVDAGQLYLHTLQAVQEDVLKYRVSPKTQARRQEVMEELSFWLQKLPLQRGLSHCTPEDILVYMHHWVHKHEGALLQSGDRVCAPSSVDQSLSHMANCFDQMGRTATWNMQLLDSEQHGGNPIRSQQVSDWRKAYKNLAAARGYLEKSAVPLQLADEQATLQYIKEEWLSTSGVKRALLSRDAAMRAILWQTKMRGKELGSLTLRNVLFEPGCGWQQLVPSYSMAAGQKLIIQPVHTKTERWSKPRPRVLEVSSRDHFDATWWLSQLLCDSFLAGCPVVKYLFRPLDKQGLRFQEKPLLSSNLHGRYQLHMLNANVYKGYTPHSSRRGALQHDVYRCGVPTAEAMASASMKSGKTLQRYIDGNRHFDMMFIE